MLAEERILKLLSVYARDYVHVDVCVNSLGNCLIPSQLSPYSCEEGKSLGIQIFPRPLGIKSQQKQECGQMGLACLAVSGDNRWGRSRWRTEGIARQKRGAGRGRVRLIVKEACPFFSRELLVASSFNYEIECHVCCNKYFSLNQAAPASQSRHRVGKKSHEQKLLCQINGVLSVCCCS